MDAARVEYALRPSTDGGRHAVHALRRSLGKGEGGQRPKDVSLAYRKSDSTKRAPKPTFS
jgi:hypothetical protein